MSKVDNIRIYFVIFFILLIAAISIFYLGNSDKSYSEVLSNIDSTEINKIEITPKTLKGEKIILKKINTQWKVRLSNGVFLSVPKEKIYSVLTPLLHIKSNRIIGKGSDLFAKYELTNSATNVKLFANNDILLNIYLGKFFFSQPRNISSCVRLANDENIYEIENLLSMQYDQNVNYFRNSNIIADNYDLWKKIVFIYPNDSSFQLTKVNEKWYLENHEIDSTKIQSYLMSVQRISSIDFLDGSLASNIQPFKKIIFIKENNQSTVSLFRVNGKFILQSSYNIDNKFDVSKSGLYKTIFVDRKYFLK